LMSNNFSPAMQTRKNKQKFKMRTFFAKIRNITPDS